MGGLTPVNSSHFQSISIYYKYLYYSSLFNNYVYKSTSSGISLGVIHISAVISLMLILRVVCAGLRFSSFISFEKLRPFECGFDPKESGRLPFSLRFFLLAVLFLIFDVEVALLIPLVVGIVGSFLSISFLGSFLFLLILIIGAFHEWRNGALRWIFLK